MLEKGTIVFGNWTVEEEIGTGAFGTVYKIKREEFGKVFYAAVKVLQIPQDKEEYRRLKSEGMDDASISNYYSQIAQDFIKEIEFLSSLDGITNIVDYKDHIIEPNENMGYTIYIKMQMLTPLAKALLTDDGSARFMDVDEVVKLGKDMCSALEVCEKRNIIHRDIKIDNIFISENGDYKLGDFGIAKQLEATQGEMSKKGTMLYMAPEVFRGENYDKTVDIYSLGIVLYRLLNKNRAPFFPNYPDPIKFSDKETANAKRLKGEVFPDIADISPELNAVLKKACAFKPSDRYQSASEFKAALENVSVALGAPVVATPAVENVIDDEKTESVFDAAPVINNSSDDEATVGVFSTVPVVKSSSDDEATVGAFDAVPAVKISSDDEATVGVFGAVPVAPVTTAPVNENNIDDEKTESVFTPAFAEEKTESVFTPAVQSMPVIDNKKGEDVFSSQENASKKLKKKSKSDSIIAIISLVVVIAIAVGVFALVRGKQEEDSQFTYEIYSAEDLIDLAEDVNAGRIGYVEVFLMNDIDLAGYNWVPIGDGNYSFQGYFDGNGYTIKNVDCNMSDTDKVGLFGSVSGTIENLNVIDAYIVGKNDVGGIVGYGGGGAIRDCSFSGEVIGEQWVGGIVGGNVFGSVEGCSNEGAVTGNYSVGGIVGHDYEGTVSSCNNYGYVNGDSYTGDIIGLDE